MDNLPEEDLETLLIKVGGRSFGVPLNHVRYVSPMPNEFGGYGEKVEDHFVFEGTPLSYVSLWDRLGLKSEFEEYEAMQTMLPQRRQDHLDWMAGLEDAIRNHRSFSKARDPHECAFGKWYYGYRAKDRRLALLMGQFETPHAVIHGLADRLLGLAECGHGSEALRAYEEARSTTLATLMRLFDSAEKLVAELQRRIAVIVADGDDTCALGADGIRDIVTVPRERIKRDTGATARMGAGVASALIILEDQSVVPLINWHRFCQPQGPASTAVTLAAPPSALLQ